MTSAAALLAAAREELAVHLELLAELVDINSHATHTAGVARCLALLAPPLEALGFAVQSISAGDRSHLLAERDGAGPTVLMMGHVDTVFTPEHPFQRLQRGVERWHGPGVADMKGGLVCGLLTLRLLAARGVLDTMRARWLVVSDEEVGSPTGIEVVRAAAPGATLALSFEAARASGDVVVARRGYGAARVIASGKSGHAGIDHDSAVNAFTALCRLVVAAEGLEQRIGGVTVSAGGLVSSAPRNLGSVPDHAECELEWRFEELAAGERVAAEMQAAAAAIGAESGAKLTIDGGVETVPMHASEASRRLLGYYVAAGSELGMRIDGVGTAGVGDINEVARFGAVCLDGVGPEGGAMHTDQEFLLIDTIAQRAAMNALALERYLRDR